MSAQIEARLSHALGAGAVSPSGVDPIDGLVDSTLVAVARRTTRARLGFLAVMGGAVLGAMFAASAWSRPSWVETTSSPTQTSAGSEPVAPSPAPVQGGQDRVELRGFGDVLPGLIGDAMPKAIIVAGVAALAIVAIRWLRRRRVSRPLGWVMQSLLALAMALIAVIATLTWTFDVFYIPSNSMAPTVEQGDRILASPGDVVPGDIVVFAAPQRAEGSASDLIKRVVAVGGDTVYAAEGQLFVNEVPVTFAGVEFTRLSDFGLVEVAPDAVFVLGDNPAGSLDSRMFGSVPADSISGIVRWASGGLPAFSGVAG